MENFFKRAVSAALLVSAVGGTALAAADELVPMGDVVGISLAMQGAVVVEVRGDGSPAETAGIQPGDVIVGVGAAEIGSAAEAAEALRDLGGEATTVTVLRGKGKRQLAVVPGTDEEGRGTLGVYLRDTLSGIGTVTYYDPESGAFGALGHPVSDADTGVAAPLRDGVLTKATVTGITASAAGEPGQLLGEIDFTEPTGVITGNTPVGIYGTATLDTEGREALPVAEKSEIETGPAVILSDALGDMEEYTAEITRLYAGGEREMMIRITDQRLLDAAGGIVQGMSGSPIVQNGKLVGAVTHVLVREPSRGYGVSLERMLQESETLPNAA